MSIVNIKCLLLFYHLDIKAIRGYGYKICAHSVPVIIHGISRFHSIAEQYTLIFNYRVIQMVVPKEQSLGASKLKTFIKITVPMMANGILSGAILSWVAIVTEMSSSIILYSNKSITLTMSTYLAILRGNDGMAAAFATILTVVTAISLLLYLRISKSEDINL